MLVKSDSDAFVMGMQLSLTSWLRPPGVPLLLTAHVVCASEITGVLNQGGVGAKFTDISWDAADRLAVYL